MKKGKKDPAKLEKALERAEKLDKKLNSQQDKRTARQKLKHLWD